MRPNSTEVDLTSARTFCGQVTACPDGSQVRLLGWVHRYRNHGRIGFLHLRDSSGVVQVLVTPDIWPSMSFVEESALEVQGVVHNPSEQAALHGCQEPAEIEATQIWLLNETSESTPNVGAYILPRGQLSPYSSDFLSLRQPTSQRCLRVRSEVTFLLRSWLSSHGFVEVDIHHRLPGLDSQFLAAAGIDRFFYVTPGWREGPSPSCEGSNGTAIELGMTFVDEANIFDAIGDLLQSVFNQTVWRRVNAGTIPTLTWQESMAAFGTEIPDMRFDLPLLQISGEDAEWLRSSVSTMQPEKSQAVRVIRVEQTLNVEVVSGILCETGLSNVNLFGLLRSPDGSRVTLGSRGPMDFNADIEPMYRAVAASSSDNLIVASGELDEVLRVLGNIRLKLAQQCDLGGPTELAFAWITEQPLLHCRAGDAWAMERSLYAEPLIDDLNSQDLNPNSLRSRAFDLVLNGQRLGRGYIGIHQPDVQRRVLGVIEAVGGMEAGIAAKLLRSLQCGAPPYGVITLAIERFARVLEGITLNDTLMPAHRSHDTPADFAGEEIVMHEPASPLPSLEMGDVPITDV